MPGILTPLFATVFALGGHVGDARAQETPLGKVLEEVKKSQEKKKAKSKKKKKKTEAKSGTKKTYTKPEPRPLPEGEAKVLDGPIALVRFNGIVNPGMGEFTIKSIHRAQTEHAQAVLIELDTPGGLVSTTQKMVQAIMQSKIPVIVYVTPSGGHAASAGTFITLAGHVAAMSPATRIGAAHPVTGGGKDPEAEGGVHMGRKIENDLVAMIEGIVEERNRNKEWAEDAVRDSISSDAKEAVEYGVVDLVAEDREALFEAIDGREIVVKGKKVKLSTKGAQVVEYELSLREKVLNFLADPGIAMLLGVIGFIGIAIEVKNPGLIIPGIVGVLAFLFSLIGMEQLPIDAGGALLVIGGIGLLVAEMYTPTYGALGLLGVVGLSVGLMLLVDPTDPDFAIDASFRLGWKEILPAVISMAGAVATLSWVVARAQRAPVVTGHESLVGMTGPVLRTIDGGEGMVLIDGEYWKAFADSKIEEGTEIEVVKVNGLKLTVQKKA